MGGTRDHSLDAARGLLMILGVPYHAALIYTPGYDWVMNSPDGIAWIGLFADFIHSFRMPAFFLISGLLITHSLRRHGPRAVLTSRASRLLVPLVAMAATLNVAQLWMESRA
ncbi:acyltransferase family protein, partial [Azospirillum brasilense]|uniref:acyltransferase family protein n=1 Tax=Azospirillum brasilense TaxID=192 RepID=UPI00190A1164